MKNIHSLILFSAVGMSWLCIFNTGHARIDQITVPARVTSLHLYTLCQAPIANGPFDQITQCEKTTKVLFAASSSCLQTALAIPPCPQGQSRLFFSLKNQVCVQSLASVQPLVIDFMGLQYLHATRCRISPH